MQRSAMKKWHTFLPLMDFHSLFRLSHTWSGQATETALYILSLTEISKTVLVKPLIWEPMRSISIPYIMSQSCLCYIVASNSAKMAANASPDSAKLVSAKSLGRPSMRSHSLPSIYIKWAILTDVIAMCSCILAALDRRLLWSKSGETRSVPISLQ